MLPGCIRRGTAPTAIPTMQQRGWQCLNLQICASAVHAAGAPHSPVTAAVSVLTWTKAMAEQYRK